MDVIVDLGRDVKGNVVRFKFREWASGVVMAKPRFGKGCVAKQMAVQISKKRKICIFDCKGEWARHVTKPNDESLNPDCLTEYKILRNFTFKISQFNMPSDFLAMNFNVQASHFLHKIISEAENYHGDDINKVRELLRELPMSMQALRSFNKKYGTDLLMPINFMVKSDLVNRWDLLKHWFWQGEDDSRRLFNFKWEWRRNKHLIIDLTEGERINYSLARAFTGRILDELRDTHIWSHGLFIFEEAKELFPNVKGSERPRSNLELRTLLTLYPKYGVSCFFLVQHPDQLEQAVFKEATLFKIVGQLENPPSEYDLCRWLRYDPDGDYREFFLIDVDGWNTKFVPNVPVCAYESQLRGRLR